MLLLVLVPFTMAPRTSLTPDPEVLALTAVLSKPTIKAGAVSSFVLQARNVSDQAVTDARLDVHVLWDGKAGTLLVTASKGCRVGGGPEDTLVSCAVGDIAPGEQVVVRVGARPTTGGLLQFAASADLPFGPVPGDVPQLVKVTP